MGFKCDKCGREFHNPLVELKQRCTDSWARRYNGYFEESYVERVVSTYFACPACGREIVLGATSRVL